MAVDLLMGTVTDQHHPPTPRPALEDEEALVVAIVVLLLTVVSTAQARLLTVAVGMVVNQDAVILTIELPIVEAAVGTATVPEDSLVATVNR